MRARSTFAAVIASGALAGAVPRASAPTTYIVDPAASQVVLHVGTSGLFSFAGHSHEVEAPAAAGRVEFDPDSPAQSTVRVEFDASRLMVTGKGEPAGDVPEVQRTMQSARVLDVSRFPRIAFASRDIRIVGQDAHRLRMKIRGDLTLHGVTRPTTADVTADVAADRLTATGAMAVKQTEFGIEPVTAGAGTVRVKDDVDIRFTFVARVSK